MSTCNWVAREGGMGKRPTIRVGDRVRVVVPREVVRVGYPKRLEDYLPEVRGRFAGQLEAIRVELTLPDAKLLDGDGCAADAVLRVERELARTLAKRDGYGGRERTVHEVECPEYLGQETTVDSLRTVYTGTYVPGGGDENGEWPPDLRDKKGRRIATVWLRKKKTPPWLLDFDVQAEVLVDNLEKVGSE